VGLEWFCGKGRLEEDYGGLYGIQKVVVWSWVYTLSFGDVGV
jgi:hypothetical protein